MNIADLLSQNWEEMRARLPFTVDTVDKEGSPSKYIFSIHFNTHFKFNSLFIQLQLCTLTLDIGI